MQPFIYDGLPCRVIFGTGTLVNLATEIDRLGAKRALVLSTPEQAKAAGDLAASIGVRAAGVFTRATMHTPVEVTEAAMQEVRAAGADCTVALGGGSTIGLGKAIALRTDLPQIAVPTTYAGSEMTPIIGETEGGRKTTMRVRTRSMARGSAAPASGRSAWRCITSSATCWAAPSICRMPKRTRSSFRMRSLTTRRPRRTPPNESRGHSG